MLFKKKNTSKCKKMVQQFMLVHCTVLNRLILKNNKIKYYTHYMDCALPGWGLITEFKFTDNEIQMRLPR